MQQELIGSTGSWTRRVLVCVIGASVTIAVVDRMRASSARPEWDSTSRLVVLLREAAGYGNATIQIGSGAERPFAVNRAALVEELQQQIRNTACSNILLRVSGGVRQGEVERLHDSVIEAIAGANVSVYVALADEQPVPARSISGEQLAATTAEES